MGAYKRGHVQTSELRCMDHPPMYGHYLRCMDETIQTSEILSIHQNSDVWLPRYAPMGADMGVFQVADAKMYGYVYLIPCTCLLCTHAGGIETGVHVHAVS